MGQSLNQLVCQRRTVPQVSFLQNRSLSKLEQYYKICKQISETFSIDSTQFIQIFGEYHPIFDLLDTNRNLLIDELELFTSMALFSTLIQVEDKVDFIFNLFDFNGLKSLSVTDLQFMFITCVAVVMKLLGVRSAMCENDVIGFVNSQFHQRSRVNISQIKNWALSSKDVGKFIHIINGDQADYQARTDQPVKTLLGQKLYSSLQQCSRNQLGCLLPTNCRRHAYTKVLQKQHRKWLQQNYRLIDYQAQNSLGSTQLNSNKPQNNILKQQMSKKNDKYDITLKLNWVYGIRHRDVKYFLNFNMDNQLVYFVGRVVVMYNIKANTQRYYQQHQQPVICVAVDRSEHRQNKQHGLVATSQLVAQDDISEILPAIHIWSPNTLRTIAVIKGHHKIGIHLMKFTNSGQYLITCGLVYDSPVIVYAMGGDYQPVYSIACCSPTVEISTLYGVVDKKCEDFVVATLYGIKHFELTVRHCRDKDKKSAEFTCTQLKNKQENSQHHSQSETKISNNRLSPISCCTFIHINENMKYLSAYDSSRQKIVVSGHERGQVYVWSVWESSIMYELCVQSSEITCLIPSCSYLMVCSNSSIINCWDIDLAKRIKLFHVDVTTLQLELNCYEVAAMVEKPTTHSYGLGLDSKQPEYVVATTKGDYFLLSLQKKDDNSLKFKIIGPRYESKQLPRIISIDEISVQRLIQRQNEQNLILFGGREGTVSFLNTSSHCIIERWKIGEPIVALDYLQTKQRLEIVVGTAYNQIYSSTNFVEKNEKYEMDKPIKCLKLIMDSNHVVLVVGLEGGHLHFINTEEGMDNKKNLNRMSTQSHNISRKVIIKGDLNFQHNKVLSPLPNGHTLTSQDIANSKQNSFVKKIKLASSPTHIISLEKKMLLISTEDNIFYILSLKDYHFNVVEPNKSPLSLNLIKGKCMNTYYCLNKIGKGHKKGSKWFYRLPVIVGKYERMMMTANVDSSVSVWKNLTENSSQNRLNYNWHSSRCISFAINQEMTRLFSIGVRDGMLVQSTILRFYEDQRSIRQPSRALVSASSLSSLTNYQNSLLQPDPQFQKQLQFCMFSNEITTEAYDQHIQIRGLQNETLTRLFKGMSQQWKQSNKKLLPFNTAPKISLKLDYVYGVETDNKRSTVLALNLPYVQFVYFVACAVIVYDPAINGQKIYRGHRYKVTCIDKILMSCRGGQGYELIVSAESAYKPTIKIWHPLTLQTITTISTVHTHGIMHIHSTPSTILSYGISCKNPQTFSLQMSQTQTGQKLACRQLRQLVHWLAINPMNQNQFCTTGKYNVTIWRIISGNIERYSVVEINEIGTYCLYRLVECREDDGYMQEIILGCENGQLGLISGCSKYISIDEKAHQKAINCIAFIGDNMHSENCEGWAQLKNKNIRHIVTCSEDETLKIWNKNFQLEFEQQARKIQFEDRSLTTNITTTGNGNMNGLMGLNDKKSPNVNSTSSIVLSKQKMLLKNIAIQSISPIHDPNNENNICLLLATRNGDVFVMKEFNTTNNQQIRKKPVNKPKQKRVSLVDKKIQFEESDQQYRNQWRKGKNSRRSSGFKKSATKLPKPKQPEKSSFILKQKDNKSKLVLNATQKRLSYLSRKLISSQQHSYEQTEQCENSSSYKRIQSAEYILYLRGHSSQICTSARPEYNNNKQKGDKLLFAHHPRLEVMVTMAEDQNLMFWDTDRNVLILNRMLGYLADPTVLKFTKDGDILIVGYSDGRLLFLDSQISKSHQGKGDEKFVLPTLRIVMEDKNTCPVLAIEQSQSGDHLAVSYNNKPPKVSQPKPQATQSSHICIFLNKSRDKIRPHGNSKIQHNIPYQNITTIPCQADSLYRTQNNNKYGIAVHEMMFTQNEGKTYLLIYEQLVDVNNHNKLNYSKDGNYIIWDVNTSTMIANTDEVCSLSWKKIAVPNSIYTRYQRYDYLTVNHEYSSEATNSNMYVNSNLLIPYISTMVNLPNYIVLGSVNGDIHIAHISCLDYDKILQSNPKNRELFVGKTYNAHCSEVSHIEYNQDRTILYTSAIGDRCVYKWRIQGDFAMDSSYLPTNQQHLDIMSNVAVNTMMKNLPIYSQLNHQASSKSIPKQQEKSQPKQEIDFFKEVPTFQQIQQMKQLYTFKQKVLWNLAVMQAGAHGTTDRIRAQEFELDKRQKGSVNNFVSMIKVAGIIGRRAYNIRDNLLYDYNARLVYSIGHTFVVLPTNSTNTLNASNCKKSDTKYQIQKSHQRSQHSEREFIHMMSGSGQDPTQQISCLCLSKDRKLVYTGHNGLNASVSAWDISTKLRLKTIILKKIMIVLIIRCSPDNKTIIVYGINAGKIAYLMLICLNSCEVLGIANFTHQKICSIKDIAYYPKSNSKFVTCGINDTLSWRLQGRQLTYTVLQSPVLAVQTVSNSAQNYTNYNKQSISICIAFLPRSLRILTGCEDGNLLFWGENSFQRKQHTDMVMVLKSCQPNILLSGSRDGTVLLWMQQSNGNGLTLSSKLNLRNQSATIFKPHGTSLLIKSSPPSIKPSESEAEQSQQSKQRRKKLQLKPTSKMNEQNSKYQNSKNTMQEIIMQELSVQSIDMFSLTEKQQNGQNSSKNDMLSKVLEQEQNMGSIRNDLLEKEAYSQQSFIPKKWKVLMGTISGNIYQTTIIQQGRCKINFDQNCQLLQIYHDHEIPKSFFFSKNDKQIYQITSRGYFCCRRIADSSVIFQQNFNKETVDMIYSAKNGIFFIVFKTEIRSFQMLDNMSASEAAQTLLKPLATLQLKFITHAQISSHQKVLAVGLIKNSDKSINVQIYDISRKQQIKLLLNFAMPTGQTIQFIDFSLNNKIVIAKLESGKMISQQLLNVQSIKQDQIPFIEWGNRAQNLYDCNRKIVDKVQAMFESTQSEQSCVQKLKILRINEITDNVFVLIDNQGHVYALNNQVDLIGYSKLKLSEASIIRFSHSKKLLGIGSEIDRSIVIFDIGLLLRRQ